MIYIKHATIYTPYKIIKDGGILIKKGRIDRLILDHRDFKIPEETNVIDAKGKIVSPGFIDVHIQGAGGYDFLDGTEEALNEISRTIANFGTTAFLATTVFKEGKNPHIENIVTRLLTHQVTRKGAQILGIHLEGPFINPKRKGMIRPNGIAKCSSSYLDKILKATRGRLRMMTIAPELKGATQIIKRLRRKRIVASFGHSDASYDEAKRGIRAGITHATHIFNAMRPLHHRKPAGITAILNDDNVSVQVIADGIHLHPAIIRPIVKLKGVKNITLITDSMSSQGLPDGKYIYDGWEYVSKDGTCRYKDGTLIGTAVPLNQMVRRMVKLGDVSLLEALQMATINPARVLGIDSKKGSIQEGKDADLIIIDEDLKVYTTIIGGDIVYRMEGKS